MESKIRTRRSPTEKQIEALEALSTQELLTRAAEAMHALNRRAKEKRDRANDFRRCYFARAIRNEIEEIYDLKHSFLTAAVEAGKAKVEKFEVTRSGGIWCPSCGHTWGGHNYDCYRCGGEGEDDYDTQTWCIVQVGSCRFHTPNPTEMMLEIAVEIPSHDPNQPQREIPDVGLTIAAQHACVEMAIDQLTAGPNLVPLPSLAGVAPANDAEVGHG